MYSLYVLSRQLKQSKFRVTQSKSGNGNRTFNCLAMGEKKVHFLTEYYNLTPIQIEDTGTYTYTNKTLIAKQLTLQENKKDVMQINWEKEE